MTDKAPFEIGKFRLVAKRWADQGMAELVFEAGDLLQPLKFFTQGKTTSIIVPLAIADEHRLGRIYTLFSQDGEIHVKP